MLRYIILYYSIRCDRIHYDTIRYNTMRYYDILSYPILSCYMLDYTLLYSTILYYTILYYTILILYQRHPARRRRLAPLLRLPDGGAPSPGTRYLWPSLDVHFDPEAELLRERWPKGTRAPELGPAFRTWASSVRSIPARVADARVVMPLLAESPCKA